MKIEKFVTGIISTNCYLVSNEETRQAVIVDPAAVPRALKETVEREGDMKGMSLTLSLIHISSHNEDESKDAIRRSIFGQSFNP